MQYIGVTTDDLKSGYSTYVLQVGREEIKFFAYTGDTAIGASEQGQKLNAYKRGYFLRKGFSDAILEADPNVLVPLYKDNENRDVFPKTKEEAVDLIYNSKINISGFRFVDGATDKQKQEALGKLIDRFVFTSKNSDFESDKNLFFVSANSLQVRYNNGGDQNMKIKGVDIQEKLGLQTEAVLKKKALAFMIDQRKSNKK